MTCPDCGAETKETSVYDVWDYTVWCDWCPECGWRSVSDEELGYVE